jgi:hypothetical protein
VGYLPLAAGLSILLVVVIGLILILGQPAGEAQARELTVADLDRIVYSDADAPAGTEPSVGGHGRTLLKNPVWYLPPYAQQRFLELPGFLDAREQSFEGPASEGDLLYVSEVFLFEDAASAQAAIDAYSGEWQVSFGFDNPMPTEIDLGDGGVRFAGPARVQYDEPGIYYFWRVNNLVLNAVGIGDVEDEELEALAASTLAMAGEMDRRAHEEQDS